jgi:formylglycine-generating enzyme required for sulfatase activity
VEIEPLHDEPITVFLQEYVGAEAAKALDTITRLDLLAHARNPYQLSVLAALYQAQGEDLPAGRGQLFAAYAHELLRREERVNHAHWIPIAVQLVALSHLGYAMQEHSESTSVSHERMLALLPHTVTAEHNAVSLAPADLLDLACRAGLLIRESPVSPATTYKFSHQLLQERFAAQHLLAQWQAGTPRAGVWWHSPRTQQDMPPATVGEWDPLPPPPPTGWEQVTILAAGMTDQVDAFVQAVVAVNPALAGRCLSEGSALVKPATREAVQRALLADLGNPLLHRRTRLAAGRVLGVVGDPCFTPQAINGVQVILPDLVSVPGGTATIGSARWPWDRQAYDDERPRHRVPVAALYLARFPVTNAEYACFILAGGYDTERYWTPAGWQWRHGREENSGQVEVLLELWYHFRQNPALMAQGLKAGQMPPGAVDTWRQLIELSEEEARQRFSEACSMQPRKQPFEWYNPFYNAPNQPVVGITWYEAMAYCAWLHEQATASQAILPVAGVSWTTLLGSGRWQVRLPTEAEWEWAAGGPQQRRYPWGKTLAVEQANTLKGRVMGTSPVGAYPAGAAACGALDMSGNVWEWTHSLYRPYLYRQHDGRDDGVAESHRVLRGGAWSSYARYVRVSSRLNAHPVTFNYVLGMRVVVAPIL